MQTISVINEDKSGNLLFGTWAGIVKYDGSSFSITDMKGALPSNFVQDILIDDNKMWVATNKGLTVIDQQGGKIIIPIEKDQLLQEDIQSISKSRDGVYFVGTSTGVYLYDPYSFQTITSYIRIDLHLGPLLPKPRSSRLPGLDAALSNKKNGAV